MLLKLIFTMMVVPTICSAYALWILNKRNVSYSHKKGYIPIILQPQYLISSPITIFQFASDKNVPLIKLMLPFLIKTVLITSNWQYPGPSQIKQMSQEGGSHHEMKTSCTISPLGGGTFSLEPWHDNDACEETLRLNSPPGRTFTSADGY